MKIKTIAILVIILWIIVGIVFAVESSMENTYAIYMKLNQLQDNYLENLYCSKLVAVPVND